MDETREQRLLGRLEGCCNSLIRHALFFGCKYEEVKDFAAEFDLSHEPTSRKIYKDAHEELNKVRYWTKMAKEHLKEYKSLESRKTKISCNMLKTLLTLARLKFR